MWKQKISLSLGNRYRAKTEDLIPAVKAAGFDGISPEWEEGADLASIAEAAKREGLALVSLHAPYGGAADMWSEDESVSRPAMERLFASLLKEKMPLSFGKAAEILRMISEEIEYSTDNGDIIKNEFLGF